MHVSSDSFRPYEFIPARCAFATHDAETHVALAGNRNPHLAWSSPPLGTKSLAVLCWDPEVPTVGDDVNEEGRTVPLDLPRTDYFHWVLFDLPADLREIKEGAHSEGVTAKGKPLGASSDGGIQAKNDYTSWFAGDQEMGGDYGGYDGPCPPWNDERVHAYRFAVYAIDVPTLGLEGSASGGDVRAAMAGHILDQGEIVGLYAINPDARSSHRSTV